MTSIADMIAQTLAESIREDRRPKEPSILPEALIAEARLHAARVLRANPFRRGDLVTARKGGMGRNPGRPAVVISAFDVDHSTPDPRFDSESGQPTYCIRPDTLIAVAATTAEGKTNTVALWTYSFELEPFEAAP